MNYSPSSTVAFTDYTGNACFIQMNTIIKCDSLGQEITGRVTGFYDNEKGKMFRVWWTHHYGTNEFKVASFIEQKNIDYHKFTTTDTVIPKPDGVDTTEQLGNNLRDIVARHTIN